MKAIMEFDMPEDRDEFTIALNGWKWQSIVMDLHNELRLWLKHGHDFKTADEVLDKVMGLIIEKMNEENLDFAP